MGDIHGVAVVEYMFGYGDAVKYTNGLKPKVENSEPIITEHGIHREPMRNQYFKGALFLNTLRNVINDDKRWFKLIHDVYQRFKYRNIMTEDMVGFFNEQTGMDLTPVFDRYLRHPSIPVLELKFSQDRKTVSFRWKADEKAFAMPVRVGKKDAWRIIQSTPEWKTMRAPLSQDEFVAATDLYYVNVSKQ